MPPSEVITPTVSRRSIGTAMFSLLAIALGVVAGFGAYGFRVLIAVVHNACFLGRLSASYDTNVHTPEGPWGVGIAVVPAIAALLVVFLVKHFAPEAKGHGVPEVVDAIHYQKGVIRPIVAGIKSVASALSIGSGGSVGREGPIIQIGAAFASWLGRELRVSRWQLATLVAAGGGAGIAATFNTPIGGVLFAVEVLLYEISVRTLVPVALATAAATFVGRYLFGDHPAFVISIGHSSSAGGLAVLPAYAGLGALAGLVGTVFIKALYGTEDRLEARIHNEYLRHALGMFGVGIVMAVLMTTWGHYYVEGVGYATVMDVMSGAIGSIAVLATLLVLKLVVTSLTLGSGASGGVFSPSLFMGATLGGIYGLVLDAAFPGLHLDSAALALAGMAGVVAASTGAALTAIVMVFEMTLDYSVVLPMTLTVAVAYGLRSRLVTDSIYTMKLTRRGHPVPFALDANTYVIHHVGELAMAAVAVLAAELPPARIDRSADAPPYVVVTDHGTINKVITRVWLAEHAEAVAAASSIGALSVSEAYVVVPQTATLVDALVTMQHANVALALVTAGVGDPHILGAVTQVQISHALVDRLTAFAD
jgi:CIC family chloride channel protein